MIRIRYLIGYQEKIGSKSSFHVICKEEDLNVAIEKANRFQVTWSRRDSNVKILVKKEESTISLIYKARDN